MGRMKIQNWSKKAVDREAWKRKKIDLRLAFQVDICV
jgi:hypothetical protein